MAVLDHGGGSEEDEDLGAEIFVVAQSAGHHSKNAEKKAAERAIPASYRI